MINASIPNGNVGGAGDAPKHGSKKQLTVEKIYQKKSQLEHILLRPDTYIGSVQPVTESQWIYDEEQKLMVKKEITYVPGLFKIFDEILVNAADNKQRDENMTQIKIDIKQDKNIISIWNNGQGIPVVKHKEEKMYVPTMIFGHLLTSSNYNDQEQKVTGGRNGYGAKLCNIFSKKFTVETASAEYGLKFTQSWEDNMSKAGPEEIEDFMGRDFTKIVFSPDLSKFKMEELDQDIVDLMTRRAFDVAASTGVTVYLNGKKLFVKDFKDYVHLFIPKGDDFPKVIHEKVNDRWEVALSISESGFQQMSFVNSIATTKGGRHVDHVTDSIVKFTIEKAVKKYKGTAIKPFQVKSHMWLFINALIVNPTFDSQTKENMTSQSKTFGSKCVLSETFFKNLDKHLGLVECVIRWAKHKDEEKLEKKSAGKKQIKLKINKLEDANNAGTRNSMECTLILTEGDSAKTLAVSGLSVIGRDTYGVFPLRGKLLNVREATSKQILENAEINNVIKILGLKYKKKYESMNDLKELRYGKLMIMTDQDQDGSHIKGLLINFIHHNWPSLLKLPFLEEFITPIVKATKGKEERSFFSLPEFEEWKKENSWHTYKIKYYKGLGTSTSKEARDYFSDMARHRIRFTYSGPNDDTNITMAFSKKCVEQRKEWLTQWMDTVKQRREMGLPEDYLYEKDTTTVNYSDFVNKELVLFSNSDNERSIPSVMDGLKPGQRKVMYTCLKRNDKKEVKVAQLAGSVAEQSAYHHGEVSLMGTIVNLAQNFVGSNNINLLQPIGQFGTRLQGGKDQASPRYIFTMLSPLTKYIFHPDDEPLLTHQYDDNLKIEPVYYVPVIPMVMVNGAEGIGTGWSTKIPNFKPRELIDNIHRMLHGDEPEPMKPWYKNFRGTIEPYGASRYTTFGELAVLNEDTIEITELPIGVWTDNYKQNVLEVMCGDGKTPGSILNFKDYNTDTTIRFVAQLTSQSLAKAEDEGLHKFFKLQNTIATSSMVAFDSDGCLRKYETPTSILKEHFRVRLIYYGKRKSYLEGMLQAESRKLSNQARFIMEKCDGRLTIENKKRIAMVQELQKKGYDPDPVKAWKLTQDKEGTLAEEGENAESQEEEDSGLEESEAESKAKYDYLLGMAMWTLTLEKKNELLKKRDEKVQAYDTLRKKSPEDLWREDLDALSAKLVEIEEKEMKEAEAIPIKAKKTTGVKSLKSRPLETKPARHGQRVVPKLDADSVKKLEKIEKPKVKRVKKTEVADEDKDEFDELIDKPTKSLKDRLGNSPEQIEKKLQAKRKGLKQSKIPFKKDSPKKKWKDGSSSSNDSESDGEMPSVSPPERTSFRRAAASKVKYNFSDESEEVEWGDDNDNESAPASKPVVAAPPADDDPIVISGTDSEFEPESVEPRNSGGSDAMFDSLLAGENVTESMKSTNDAPKKKAIVKKAPAVKKATVKRPKKKDDSDDDDEIFPQRAPKKGKKKESDDSFEIDSIVEPKTGRKRTYAPKYVMDSDSDDDFE